VCSASRLAPRARGLAAHEHAASATARCSPSRARRRAISRRLREVVPGRATASKASAR
jgi:hypothetical protein